MKTHSEDGRRRGRRSRCPARSRRAPRQIKVGFSPEAYPPFYSQDASGNWGGWEVEIINAICAEAKLECELTPIPWDGLIPALTSKKIDAIMNSMSITDERKKTIDFSDKYYNTPTAIIGPKDQKFDATPEGLKGKMHRRAGLDHAFRLRQEALHRGRRDQGVPDPGRGQPGSRRRPHRRDAGRLRSRSTPS